MESLYRKYRPLTFDDVVGQHHVVSTLKRAIIENKTSHAYLFCGPRGTGKTTLARILAKALICQKGENQLPDGTCENCRLIAAGNHPDVYELDAASRTGVDNVREEIISRIDYAPVRGSYKIYIIDEVHMLTPAAFNALLKTLEEPPSHVTFIMCTTDPQKILETILSRVQRFDFHAIDDKEITERLRHICTQEGFSYEDSALDSIARHARGSMRDALSTLEQLSVFCNGTITLEATQDLLGEVAGCELSALVHAAACRDIPALFNEVAQHVRAGHNLLQLTQSLIHHLRDVYVVSVTEPQKGIIAGTAEELAACKAEADAFGNPNRIARMLTILGETTTIMRSSPNQQLALELALTRIARPESDVTLESLQERIEILERAIASQTHAMPVQKSKVAATPHEEIKKSTDIPPLHDYVDDKDAPAKDHVPETTAKSSAFSEEPCLQRQESATQKQPGTTIGDARELQRAWHKVVDMLTQTEPACGSLLAGTTASADDGRTLVITLAAQNAFVSRILEGSNMSRSIGQAVEQVIGKRSLVYRHDAMTSPAKDTTLPGPTAKDTTLPGPTAEDTTLPGPTAEAQGAPPATAPSAPPAPPAPEASKPQHTISNTSKQDAKDQPQKSATPEPILPDPTDGPSQTPQSLPPEAPQAYNSEFDELARLAEGVFGNTVSISTSQAPDSNNQ